MFSRRMQARRIAIHCSANAKVEETGIADKSGDQHPNAVLGRAKLIGHVRSQEESDDRTKQD